MRLSEAIRLGSLAIQKPLAGDVRTCAIGMACKAVGDVREGLGNYTAVRMNWPWTDLSTARGNYISRLTFLFDHQVCEGAMTLEGLCDMVCEWERECEAKGINIEQVTMAATPELTHEPAAEHSHRPEYVYRGE